MAFPILILTAQIRSTILLYAALLTPPSTLSQRTLSIFFLPAIYLCHLYTFSSPLAFLSVLHCFWSTHLLLFTNPREDFGLICRSKFKSRNGETREWRESYPREFRERFWWITKLLLSPRMIGWETSAPANTPDASKSTVSIPKSKRGTSPSSKTTPRLSPSPSPIPHVKNQRLSTWLLERFILATICFILLDATNWWMNHDLYFHNIYIHEKGDIDTGLWHNTALWTSFLNDLPKWVDPLAMRVLVFGIQEYAMFNYLHSLLAIFFVALGKFGIVGEFWGSSYNWPSLFGSLSFVFERGLRGFWGCFWHQLFREMFVGPGKALARVLGFPAGSTSGYAIITATAFFASGAFHTLTLPTHLDGMDPRLPAPNSFGYASFFWLQGVCVLLEFLIGRLVKMVMPEKNRGTWSRLLFGIVRAAWVLGVLYLSAPLLIDEVVKVLRAMGLRPVFLFSMGERLFETNLDGAGLESTPIIELIDPPLTRYLIGAATATEGLL